MNQTAILNHTTAKKVITHPYFAILCFLTLCFILPRYCGSAITMIGCASILSVYLAVLPDQFRSRSGSLLNAICLVAILWVAAATIAAMTLAGQFQH